MIEKLLHFFLIISLMIPGKIRLDESLPHYGGAEFVLVPFDIVFFVFCIYKFFSLYFKKKSFIIKKDSYLILLFVYIVANVIILPFSMSINYSIYEVFRLTKLFIWFIFLREFLLGESNLKPIMYGFAFIILIQFIFVSIQSVTGLGLSGWNNADARELSVVSDSMFGAAGTFGHPGILSQFVVIILPLFYICFIESDEKLYKNIMKIAFFASIYIIVQTYARTGILITFFLLCLIFFHYFKIQKVFFKKINFIVFFIFTFTIGFYLFFDKILIRFDKADPESGNIRIMLNNVAYNMIEDNPLFGVGLNSFTEVLGFYDYNSSVSYLKYPVHNIYLLVLSENGLLIGVFFIILNLYILVSIFRNFLSKFKISLEISNYSYALSLSFLSILAFGILGWSWRLDFIQPLYWFIIAFASNVRFNRFK